MCIEGHYQESEKTPRDCHTEWSKPEREKQISYINAYMWNLEKWHRWTGLQRRNKRHRCREQKYGYQGGKGCSGRNWEIVIDTYIIDTMYKIDNWWKHTV